MFVWIEFEFSSLIDAKKWSFRAGIGGGGLDGLFGDIGDWEIENWEFFGEFGVSVGDTTVTSDSFDIRYLFASGKVACISVNNSDILRLGDN